MLKNSLLIALTLFSLCVQAQSLHDEFSQALSQYQQKNYSAAKTKLEHLTQQAPRNALYWFNLGTTQFMLNEMDAAERSFQAVIQLDSPLTPAAILYRAKALSQKGDIQQAQTLLNDLVTRRDLPPGLHEAAVHDRMALTADNSPNAQALDLYKQGMYDRALKELNRQRSLDDDGQILKALTLIKLDRQDQANILLQKLQDQGSPQLSEIISILLDHLRDTYSKSRWLFVESALAYDSNIRRTEQRPIGIGWQLGVGAGERLWSKDLWLLNAGYYGHWSETLNASDLRVYSHEVQASLGQAAGTNLLLITSFLQHESWIDRPERFATGFRLHLRGGTERQELGMTAEWQHDWALDSANPYLAGADGHLRGYIGTLRAPFYAQAYVEVGRGTQGDQDLGGGVFIPGAHTSFGPGGRLLWKGVRDWAADVSAAYQWRWYDQARRDSEWIAAARLTRLIKKGLSVHATIAFDHNTSSLHDLGISGENYERLQIFTGGLWDAF